MAFCCKCLCIENTFFFLKLKKKKTEFVTKAFQVKKKKQYFPNHMKASQKILPLLIFVGFSNTNYKLVPIITISYIIFFIQQNGFNKFFNKNKKMSTEWQLGCFFCHNSFCPYMDSCAVHIKKKYISILGPFTEGDMDPSFKKREEYPMPLKLNLIGYWVHLPTVHV